jgi:hypothetical protein
VKILSYLVRTLFQPLFLFSLFVTNSAVIYCACILEHTQTSLALEIMQKAIISPAPKTMYIKDGVFQYNHYIEDLEDVKLYLRNQKINSSINVVGRGGDVFLIPRILRPIVKKITGKRHYELITKLISAGAVITIAGFTFNSIKEIYSLPILFKKNKYIIMTAILGYPIETQANDEHVFMKLNSEKVLYAFSQSIKSQELHSIKKVLPFYLSIVAILLKNTDVALANDQLILFSEHSDHLMEDQTDENFWYPSSILILL